MKRPHFEAPRAIEPATQMLERFIEERIAEGASFKPGDSVLCSWMLFQVGNEEQGRLPLLAPRQGVMPMSFVPDCSCALNLVLAQRYVCDSFEVIVSACNACQAGIAIKNLKNCKQVFMNRTDEEEGNASGWFFGALDSASDVNDRANLEPKSLWELSCSFPKCMDFFLLPPGWQVLLEDRPIVLHEGEPAVALSNSYFAAKYQ